MTFDGMRPFMESDLWWKLPINGRQPLMEDNLQWKISSNGRNLRWKTIFNGKTTFGGRLSFWTPSLVFFSKTCSWFFFLIQNFLWLVTVFFKACLGPVHNSLIFLTCPWLVHYLSMNYLIWTMTLLIFFTWTIPLELLQ